MQRHAQSSGARDLLRFAPSRCLLADGAAITAVAMLLAAGHARAEPSFTGVGVMPGGGPGAFSFMNGMAGDGSVVVGNGDRSPVSRDTESARWTPAGGLQSLGLPASVTYSTARAASMNGEFIVGYHQSLTRYSAYRWSTAGGYQDLGDLPGGSTSSLSYDISRDGRVVVGLGNYAAFAGLGFIWREGVGMFSMGDLPGGIALSQAIAVSGDGLTVIGGSQDADDFKPVKWTQETGLVALPDLEGGSAAGTAQGISNDGRFIVGRTGSSLGDEATLWRDYGAVAMGLGDLPGGPAVSLALDVTDDGSMVVGYADAADGERGFIWTEAAGMRDAKTVLEAEYGLNLSGWTIGRVNAITPDGRMLTGDGMINGRLQGWVAVIPSPGTVVVLAMLPVSAAARRRR